MVCLTPQITLHFYGEDVVDCGCCSGCIRAMTLTNRERQAKWFQSMKRRYQNG